jgi:hypothetical protein
MCPGGPFAWGKLKFLCCDWYLSARFIVNNVFAFPLQALLPLATRKQLLPEAEAAAVAAANALFPEDLESLQCRPSTTGPLGTANTLESNANGPGKNGFTLLKQKFSKAAATAVAFSGHHIVTTAELEETQKFLNQGADILGSMSVATGETSFSQVPHRIALPIF